MRNRVIMDDLPVRPRRPGKYTLTEQDGEKLKEKAVDGVIPFQDYIKTINEILNPK